MATVTLNRYSAGETGYVAKFNTDNVTIEAAFAALTDTIGGGGGSATGAGLNDIWPAIGRIGKGAFVATQTGATLVFTSGAVYNFPQSKRQKTTAATTLDFTGQTAGDYNVIVDGAGGLQFSAASAVVPGSAVILGTTTYTTGSAGALSYSVAVLFHGDDYSAMLSSVNYGTFTAVADRLSAMEGGQGTQDLLYAEDSVSGAGWGFKSGHLRNNNIIVSTAAGLVSLEATQTHYIEVNITTGAVSYATGGWTSSTDIPIRFIQTAAGAVTSNGDVRTWATAGGAGSGAHPVVISGTTDGLWKLYLGNTAPSGPVSDAGFVVVRGSANNVEIRYNETDDVWQYTNDGINYFQFGAVINPEAFNAGAGNMTRYNALTSAPEILALTLVGTSGPAILSLSTYVSTTTVAVAIRGTAFDDGASPATAEPFPGVAFYYSSSFQTALAASKIYAGKVATDPEIPQMVIVPANGQTIEYSTWAASDASLRTSCYLVGYWDLIQGVGTQLVSATVAGIAGGAGATDVNYSAGTFSAAGNRLNVFFTRVSSDAAAGTLYDLEFYAASGRAADDLLFQALNIDASAVYTTRLPWVYRDTTSTGEVHMRISAVAGHTYSLEWHAEKFA